MVEYYDYLNRSIGGKRKQSAQESIVDTKCMEKSKPGCGTNGTKGYILTFSVSCGIINLVVFWENMKMLK